MSEEFKQSDHLNGISGWLILVAIGIVIIPSGSVYQIAANFPALIDSGIWKELTSPGSSFYNPLFAAFLLAASIVSILLILAQLYLAFLFFFKKSLLPKWYIVVAIVTFILLLLAIWIPSLIFADKTAIGSALIIATGASFLLNLIWIPYMLKSKRVKLTFVN